MTSFEFETHGEDPSLGSAAAGYAQILDDSLTPRSKGWIFAEEDQQASVLLAFRAVNGTAVLRFRTVIASRIVPATEGRVGVFFVNQSDILSDPTASWMGFELTSSDAWNARHYIVRLGGRRFEFVCSYLEVAQGIDIDPEDAIASLSARAPGPNVKKP